MDALNKGQAYPIRIKYYTIVLALMWSIIVVASLVWNVYQTKKNILDVARIQALASFKKDVLYRRWNAGHGGVYVQVTEKTPPNPYLRVAHRDILIHSAKVLTMMNPAYMTRQVHELAEKTHGVKGHITSLNPIRPANAPDPWETQALQAFQDGTEEVSSVENIKGQNYLRFMRPLVTEKGCLKCHAIQGYKLGDIRGGISIAVPLSPILVIWRSHILTLYLGHALLWLVGIVKLGLGTYRLNKQVIKRELAEDKLKEHSDNLESMVQERTLEITKSEKKFHELADLLPMVVFEMDMAGNITYINRLGFEYTDYNREENEAGVHVFQFVAPEDHEKLQQRFLKMLEGEEGKPYEYTLIKKDGTQLPCMFYSSIIDNEDQPQPLGLRGAIVDISEIKQTEKKLIEAKEAAEASNKAKSEFLANMSHELRTPMNAIQGMAHLCFQTELTEQQRNYLTKLDHAYRALMKLINDLFDFSKIEEGDLEIDPIPFDLRGFLENLKSTFLPVVQKKHLDFDLSFTPEVPTMLAGDVRRLSQILSNLLDNAIKFTEQGGVALRIDRELSNEQLTLYFEIEDTGIGMTQEQMSQLFKPFTQIDGSPTRKYGGTGLGLSLTKRLVEMMGGTINVESEKGKGSTFSFTAVFEIVTEEMRAELEDTDAGGVEVTETPSKTVHLETDTIEHLDVSIIAPKLVDLSELIKDDDTRAIKKLRDIKDDLNIPAISGDVVILENALGEYDFENALATLGRIMDQIGMTER